MKFHVSLTPFIALFVLASTTPTPLTPPEITIDHIKSGIRCCNQLATGWLDASTPKIQTGINTLKSNGGKCSVGAASCTQLFGNADTEIVLCNNNPVGSPPIERDCAELATYADDVVARCNHDNLICGQKFDTALFSIIIKHI